jgi:tRNA (cmo5U34)-methyltransferase
VGQFHDTPDRYLALMREAIPVYDELEDAVAAAIGGEPVGRLLDLGIGTGLTTARVLRRHPGLRVVGLDVSARMLALAAATLPPASVEELREAPIDAELPVGRFDAAISALCVHHLDAAGKQALFVRLRPVVDRLVVADVVVPDDPADAVTPIDPAVDFPDRLDDQLAWLSGAGFEPSVAWTWRDLAVVAAR